MYEYPVAQPISARELAELTKNKCKDCFPKLKLSQFDGNALNWHESFGQFSSNINSAPMSNDEKIIYLKTLVSVKAIMAINGINYSGALYNDAIDTLQRMIDQLHNFVVAHWVT